jgi:hypothetical protein
MAIRKDRDLGESQGPWYPEAGVKNRAEALAYIAEYFPGILAGPNTIGPNFSENQSLHLLPKGRLQHDDRFIAEAGQHQLRYFLKSLEMNEWELQYSHDYKPGKPDFFLAWKGKFGSAPPGLHINFVDQLNLYINVKEGKFCALSMGRDSWKLEESINSPDLSAKIQKLSKQTYEERFKLEKEWPERRERLVIINNVSTDNNLLVLDVENDKGEGQIAIPTIVTPTRFA